MFTFEIKKHFRQKKPWIILLFSLFLCVYAYLLQPDYLTGLIEGREEADWFSIYSYFPDSSNKKIQDIILEYNEKEAIDSSQSNIPYVDVYKLEKLAANSSEYREGRRNYLKYELHSAEFNQEFIRTHSDIFREFATDHFDEQRQNLKWQVFKNQELLRLDEDDPYTNVHPLGENMVEAFIHRSPVLLGLPVFLFFILLYANFYAEERENETIHFLYTQPLAKARVILAKALVILLDLVLYLLFLGIFSFLILSFLGLPLAGGQALYRIMDPGNLSDLSSSPLFYYGWEVLVLSLLSFLSIALFWSMLSLFFSTRFQSHKALALSLTLFAGLFVLTQHLPLFQNSANPLFAGKVVLRLLGERWIWTSPGGMVQVELFPPSSPVFSLVFIGYSLLLFALSCLPKVEVVEGRKAGRKRSMSLLKMETLKIVDSQGFRTFFIGSLVVLVILFIPRLKLARDVRQNQFGDEGFLSVYQEESEDAKKELDHIQDPDTMNHLYGNEKEGYIPVKEWTEEIKTYYQTLLASYEAVYREHAEKLTLWQSLIDSYKNNDSAAYYDALSRRAQNEVDWYDLMFRKMNYPGTSLSFTQDIYREAGKRGAKPLVGVDVISISPYNHFENPKVRDEYVLQTSKNEADGFFFPYDMLISEHSGLLCLALLLLMVMTGYTTDREEGRQIELMYTSGYRRKTIHWMKILAHVLTSVFVIAIFFGFQVLLGGIFEGFGSYNYPVAFYENGGYRFISVAGFVGRSMVTLFLVSFFVSALATFLSLFIRKKNNLIFATVAFLLAGYVLCRFLPASLRALTPFPYLEVSLVANNSISILRDLPLASPPLVMAVLLVWGLVFGLAGQWLVQGKDYE
ncbi:ABC transporter permease subunit [Kallipyga massiliensis]|uniref:ABC transporter permease subunit n=1 Tax=Kallipyga massiliensis TaxID=1472764 RepID=UPI0026EE958F|nr:ABC transporter permease subunit [Kallipyga massiliensis]